MANTDRFVTEIRTDVQQLVHHLEQAQMIAQRINLKYSSMGGEIALTGFVWPVFSRNNFLQHWIE